ncbi:LacI family DNA-binding transcriptional regulator [Gracilibacillus sp. YIM 98692]|uniref:LacI family DNA-binding transcriptional regulator n=1 Tax=Gracilibacillus sp. YIM 98692 TaxID=2663532 RepID=UPI0013CF7FE9|nr:LacI family DNA-binding transcriptional regulator [Gracilibacillus sp. YIM 98692]
MVSITDVAKYAGVSKSTVSRVLNGKVHVNKETERKVLDAIDLLGYSPNAAARTLSTKKTNSIGVVLERLHDPIFAELIQGIGEQGGKDNYYVIYSDAQGMLDEKNKYIEFLTHGRVDGVLIFGSYLTDKALIKKLSDRNFPFVLIENEFDDVPTNSILIDNVGGAQKGVNHLLELGHKKIGHITGNMNTKAALDRLNGFILAMQGKQLIIEGEHIAYNYSKKRFEDGYRSMTQLLNASERPTAVFISDQIRSYGAIQAIYDKGLTVPNDIAVVGFDDQKFYDKQYNGPALTTISQPFFDIGKESVRVLIDEIEERNENLVKKTFDTELIIRQSCGAKQKVK